LKGLKIDVMEKVRDFMFFVALALLFIIGFVMGNVSTREETKVRALELGKKECYTNQDIEIIVFGEIQE